MVEKKTEEAPKKAGGSLENESKLLGAISYILGIFALIIYLIKKDDRFVRFHALQSAFLSIVIIVLTILFNIATMVLGALTAGIGAIAMLCTFPLFLVAFAYIIYLAYKAYQGEMVMVPMLGELAEKYV
ncbi:DUF4870 domain-containing protein [Candidatus Micrarchaeota archaeon]|nr:DUF4870 domain-containing protein [Candidatus Micrarchaeota archaeon]